MIIADHSPPLFLQTHDSRPGIANRIALIDSRGYIVAVNRDWMVLAEQTGAALDRVRAGVNYLDVCRQASSSSAACRQALNGIQAVLKEKTSHFAMDYDCDTPLGVAYFRMRVSPIAYADARVAISHTEVTDLQAWKEGELKRLQQFARRLINVQEEERQKLSREIHDDLGHRIALMSFSVRQLIKEHAKQLGSSVRDMTKILDGITEFSTALRDMSHWLHPAPLRYLGIPAALKSLRTGFEETYAIQMDLVVPSEMPRLSDEVELCVFRVTQESLQNAAKHSGADKISIQLEHTAKQIQLTVTDCGRGFDRSEAIPKGGLGLLSMEERALSIGGTLKVNSALGAGTEIRLTIPIEKTSDAHG